MNIIIRTKTLKTFAGFLGICLIFAGGVSLKDKFNPHTAADSNFIAKADPEIIATPVVNTNDQWQPVLPVMTQTKDTTTEFRISRALSRSQELELLESIIQDSTVSEVERIQARKELLAKARQTEAEVECEGALTAKGFQDVLVTIRKNMVTILMETNILSDDELLQISDIVCRITGCLEEDIIVIPN